MKNFFSFFFLSSYDDHKVYPNIFQVFQMKLKFTYAHIGAMDKFFWFSSTESEWIIDAYPIQFE